VPAASACTITNLETCRDFYITLLVTDVILLLIMLVGLLRLRHRAKGSLELARLLWKQVRHWWFLSVIMLLTKSHHLTFLRVSFGS
jgi:hypothetical protein